MACRRGFAHFSDSSGRYLGPACEWKIEYPKNFLPHASPSTAAANTSRLHQRTKKAVPLSKFEFSLARRSASLHCGQAWWAMLYLLVHGQYAPQAVQEQSIAEAGAGELDITLVASLLAIASHSRLWGDWSPDGIIIVLQTFADEEDGV
eukprot:18127-Heterococcus_DN1.PRE.2